MGFSTTYPPIKKHPAPVPRFIYQQPGGALMLPAYQAAARLQQASNTAGRVIIHRQGGEAPASSRGGSLMVPASHRAAPASIQHSRAGNHTPTGRRGNSEARHGSRHPQQPTAAAVPGVLLIKPRRFPSTNSGEAPASLSVTKIPTNDSLI